MIHHFEKFDEVRHPREDAKTAWIESREYIKDVFEKIGLKMEAQCFNTTVMVTFDHEEQVSVYKFLVHNAV